MDIGGRNGTHHSALQAQLERKGLVESRTRSAGIRGSKLYRLTHEGRALGAQLTAAASQEPNR
jgi:DNA-binding MarR family transcriptional regulator